MYGGRNTQNNVNGGVRFGLGNCGNIFHILALHADAEFFAHFVTNEQYVVTETAPTTEEVSDGGIKRVTDSLLKRLVHKKDLQGRNFFFSACEGNNVDVLQYLLSEEFGAEYRRQVMGLSYVEAPGHAEVIDDEVDGVPLDWRNLRDYFGNSLLSVACFNGARDCVKLILEHTEFR